jgi:hypothetical protein
MRLKPQKVQVLKMWQAWQLGPLWQTCSLGGM